MDGEKLRRAVQKRDVEKIECLLNEKVDVDSADNKGVTSLHIASSINSSNIVEILISHGASIDVACNNSPYTTPLSIAVNRGHEKIVKILLSNNAKVDTYIDWAKSLLDIAVSRKDVGIARALLRHGAPVDSLCCPRSGKRSTYPSLHCAILDGHNELIKLLIDSGVAVNPKDINTLTPLHVAVDRGDIGIIKTLFEHGANVDSKDEQLRTPLHMAVEWNTIGIVKTLFEHGANVDPKDQRLQTPLHIAVKRGDIRIVKTLFEHGANVDSKDEQLHTPLHIAMKQRDKGIVKTLFEHGANVDSKDLQLRTPLHMAVEWNTIGIVKTLFEHGANVDPKDQRLQTPLHIAVKRGDIGIVKTLFEHGANVDSKDEQLQTPLHMAVEQKNIEIIKTLLEHGANVNPEDDRLQALFQMAMEQKDIEIGKTLLEHGAGAYVKGDQFVTLFHKDLEQFDIGIVKTLLEHGVNVESKDDKLQTPLYNAIQMGRSLIKLPRSKGNKSKYKKLEEKWEEIIKLLLKHGAVFGGENEDFLWGMYVAVRIGSITTLRCISEACPDAMVSCCNTLAFKFKVLHIAVHMCDINLVEFFIHHGANVNTKDKSGRTAIFYVGYGDYYNSRDANKTDALNIVKLLLSAGADVDIKGKDQKIVHHAVQNNHFEMIELLLFHNDYIQNPRYVATESVSEYNALHSADEDDEVTAVMNSFHDIYFVSTSSSCDLILNPYAEISNEHLSPLCLAIKKRDWSLVKLFVRYKFYGGDAGLRVALHMAVRDDLDILVKHILEFNPDADVVVNNKGRTLLHEAIVRIYPNTAEMLIINGCDLNAVDQNGKTPLLYALEGATGERPILNHKNSYRRDFLVNQSNTIVKCLLEHGARVDPTDNNLMTMVRLGIGRGYHTLIETLLKHCSDINILLHPNGSPLLHTAIERNDAEMASLLIKYGASVNATNENGKTALHLAASDYPKITEMLLEYGVDVDRRDEKGETALHIAAHRRELNDFMLMLKYGADINITCNDNRTPLDYIVLGSRFHTRAHNEMIYEIKEHVMKMQAANLFLSQHNLQLMATRYTAYNTFKAEFEKMREAKVADTSFCFSDMLTGIQYARNESVVRTLRSCDYKERFPLYSDLIKNNFERARKRIDLLDRSATFSSDLLGYELPENVTMKIFGYLCNCDLNNVIKAYTN